jgi:putative membrane protein
MMTKLSARTLPLAAALAFSLGSALAQTSSGATATPQTTPNTGSSMTGGGAAPAAQPGTGTRNTPKSTMARADRKFIEKTAQSGMFEVQVAQEAANKASDPAVKDFAGRLLKDHTAANDELVKLANSKGVEVPAAPGYLKRRAEDKMAKRSGADFDQHFVREVGIKDHEKDIKAFEKESEKAKDPDLKAWVDKTLPTLREHLAMAQKLPEATRNTSAMGNRGAKSSSTAGSKTGG